MQILTLSEAEAGLAQVMDKVCRSHEPIMIVSRRGRKVVLLPLKEFNSINETIHLLGSASNASRLRKSIAQHKAGTAVAHPRAAGDSSHSESTSNRGPNGSAL
ncbi:type II toxin-antitoxin system Phd/YefM family antitoxin [Pseudomonas sp. NPDC090202]|uniref:type II toxin-antitoxin system Phd/YefM family antitoxin n=1 Tax=Pseudomonas sp. NPDC090202 TaxID=3364476 RepID=UPI00382549D3